MDLRSNTRTLARGMLRQGRLAARWLGTAAGRDPTSEDLEEDPFQTAPPAPLRRASERTAELYRALGRARPQVVCLESPGQLQDLPRGTDLALRQVVREASRCEEEVVNYLLRPLWREAARAPEADRICRSWEVAVAELPRRGVRVGLSSPGTPLWAVLARAGWKSPRLRTWVEFLRSGVWQGVFGDGTAWVWPAPSVARDPSGLLHRLDGPAIVWGDGFGYHYVRGIRVAGEDVLHPERITGRRLQATSAEKYLAWAELLGVDRLLEQLPPRVMDQDRDAGGRRRLLRVEAHHQPPLQFVEVHCPSTRKRHRLRVPPDIRSCRHAVAWTFGFETDLYLPLYER
ncbi:MAG: hypothetical protein HY319_29765 [Armatimonadetes bacterium]|nr:hypothetical protein [Armatimonadota bacterium]